MRDGYLRGSLPRTPTARQVDVLAAFVAAGGSVADAAARVGVRPSTAKRHLADLRARSGLTTEQLIYRGRARGGSSCRPWSPARSPARTSRLKRWSTPFLEVLTCGGAIAKSIDRLRHTGLPLGRVLR